MLTTKDGEHQDVILYKAKIHGVRKTLEHRPANLPANLWGYQRIVHETRHDVSYGLCELGPKTGSSLFVPNLGIEGFDLRLGAEFELACHSPPCSLRRTSSQGIAESGFSRWAAERRSNSVSSSGVRESSRWRSASVRLCHNANASSARSSGGSWRSSERDVVDMLQSSHAQLSASKSACPALGDGHQSLDLLNVEKRGHLAARQRSIVHRHLVDRAAEPPGARGRTRPDRGRPRLSHANRSTSLPRIKPKEGSLPSSRADDRSEPGAGQGAGASPNSDRNTLTRRNRGQNRVCWRNVKVGIPFLGKGDGSRAVYPERFPPRIMVRSGSSRNPESRFCLC